MTEKMLTPLFLPVESKLKGYFITRRFGLALCRRMDGAVVSHSRYGLTIGHALKRCHNARQGSPQL